MSNLYVKSVATDEFSIDENLKKLIFKESETVLIISFIPSIFNFEAICKKIKEFFKDSVVVATTTAGELCNIETEHLYCKNKILITSFSSKLFKKVDFFKVKLFGEDIKNGEILVDNKTRVDLIKSEFEKIEIDEVIDYRKSFVYTLIDSSSNSEGFFVEAFYGVKKFPCPIIGGSSGSYDLGLNDSKLFFNGEVLTDSAILLHCVMDDEMDYCLFKSKNFTRVDKLFEVLNSDVALRYVSYVLNKDNEAVDIITFLSDYFKCKESELEEVFKDYTLGLVINGKEYIRSIREIDLKHRRIYFFSDLAFEDSVYLFKKGNFVENTKRDLDNFLKDRPKPVFAIFNDCVLRKNLNGKSIYELDGVLDFKVVGFSTFGEIFGVNVNQTLSSIFFFRKCDKFKNRKNRFIVEYAEYSNFFLERYVNSARSRQIFENYEKLESLVEQLKESNKKIEEISKHKSEFLSNMSHEIRTPLNAILGFIEILKDLEKDEEKLKYIDIIMQSSKHLLGIINDILDFNKIESGKLEIVPVDFSSDEFELVYKLFLAKSELKSINFVYNITQNVPKFLNGDIFRIRQIIVNLLGNAFKFTNSGKSIYYTVDWIDERLVVIVEDEGKGIAQDKIEKIFESFTQEDGSTTREYGGSGLGLTISKRLIDMMNGEINVRSSLGVGSRFEIKIPLKVGSYVESKRAMCSELDIRKKRILVAEDNESNRMFIKVLLKKYEVDLEFANDGVEAVEKFRNNKYDLIFMDENMPNMSGVDATQKILKIEKENGLKHTPIVALTANALSGDRERFLSAGMDEYLSKPIDRNKMCEVFEKYLM